MTSLDTYLNLCTQVYDLSKPTPRKILMNFIDPMQLLRMEEF